MNINFNTDILSQLLVRDREIAALANDKFPKVGEWTNNIAKPTYLQLVDLAKFFNIPFGYFFLEKIPVKNYPIPHYRTVSGKLFKPSAELVNTIEEIEQRQIWASETLKDYNNPLKFANSISVKTDINEAAQLVRTILDLPINWTVSENIATWKDAFFLLLKRAEATGIFVVVNSQDGGKKLNVQEFRGFVLFDMYAPFIFINGNDFVTGKIFTIIHEIVHVLIGKSASFDFADLSPAHNEIEQFCDQVTAEFLVPASLLLERFKVIGNDYNKLSEIFKVSRVVIARRLLDFNKIDRKEFLRAYNSFKKSSIEITPKTGGGLFYYAAPYRISRQFFNLIYANVKSNKLLYRDAFRLTGLTPKSFDGYLKKHLNKE